MKSNKVDVYKNLHKNCYSLKVNGYVVAHTKSLWLRDAEFIVNPAGRDRVRKTGVKNVHAYVRGQLGAPPTHKRDNFRNAYYNPKVYDSFVDCETLKPVKRATFVKLDSNGVHYHI